ncbi:PH domain-containing protein [Rhodococcus marinonascens]|uniref:PH domain-containing protein n=1 Tax=Rhodococcus marinonascens TaxID=38311 RepID=UPI000934920F|nr:PH domain-containing protein [Rhodococcus marinonascens]
MGYPEGALAEEEELLLHSHPHWKMLLLPAVILLTVTAAAGFAVGFAENELDASSLNVVRVVILVLWLAVVVWRCLAPFLRWKSKHFVVTDRRVLVREGVMTHIGIDIPMGRISNVQFRHGLLDRMLRTGTLVIVSSSDDPLEFDDIPDIQRVHSLLYHQVFDAMDLRRDHDREHLRGDADTGKDR